MNRTIRVILLMLVVLMFGFCSRQEEISPERMKVLADTLAQDLEYEPWMEMAYELAKNYPEEYVSGMVLIQAAERSIMEEDSKRFKMIFELLKHYPESGALEMIDQIAICNRFAWIMSSQMLLPDEAPAVIAFAIDQFKAHEAGLQYRDELGSMIYDTQAVIFEITNDTTKALEAYDTAIAFYGEPETLLKRGLILEATGELDAALEDYISALSRAPNEALIASKVKTLYAELNPDQDAVVFLNDLQESLQESRREAVLAEAFFIDAPEFEFTDLSGKIYNNLNMLGKVFFVDFWATWCNPCRRELPEFQAFYEMNKDNPRVAFIAASTDSEREKVVPYISEMNYTFPVCYAAEAAAKFEVEGIPSLFIIGPEGKIRYKIVGFDPDKDFAREMTWRMESLLDD